MKAVILAAGQGTRMRPLTDKKPKPMLQVGGKPIIRHTYQQLKEHVEEVIIVTGYRAEDIEEEFRQEGDVSFVTQEKAEGTADAALKASEKISGRAAIVNGDDIYKFSEIPESPAIMCAERDDPTSFGVLELEEDHVTNITEKPDNPSTNKVNTGFYVVENDFFDLLEDVEKSERGEYEITDALNAYIEKREMKSFTADLWMPCSYPWQLLEANEKLLEDLDKRVKGRVHSSAQIEGDVVVEEGAQIRQNTTVEGPVIIRSGARIGPGAYIRPNTVIHRNVHVGTSEVKNSVLCKDAAAPHFNYIGDSYIMEGVNFGAGSKTANLRNDGKDVKIEVKGELMDTGKRKMGSFMAENVKIGINCSLNPGTVIGPGTVTNSGLRLSGKIEGDQTLREDR